MTTIKDIANLAGVTYVTVSRALNNEPGVSEKTRRKILSIAEQLEYVPNMAAKRLADRTSNGIGLIWPKKDYPFFYHLCNKVEEDASARGYAVMVSMSGREEALKSFQSFFIDRVIHWVMQRSTPEYLKAKQSFKGKIVEVGGWKQEHAHRIDIDRKDAVHQAVGHLVGLGHRKIGFIGGHTDKWVGYTEAQVHYQLEYAPEIVVMTSVDDPEKDQKLSAYFDGCEAIGVTALIIDSQGILYDSVKHLNAKGIRVPGQLSLVVYDDLPEVQSVLPVQLTTVGPDLTGLARTMVDLVTAKADEASDGLWLTETVSTQLIVRNSTRAI